jgi:copper(I)-binding protein
MTFLRIAACAAALILPASLGFAHDGIHIHDPYARIIAGSGVVYFQIESMESVPDTLLSARTDIGMAMLMNSTADAKGVMRMRHVPEGFTVDAGQVRLLSAAADHVMLWGMTGKPRNGDTFTLTLTFAGVGDIAVTVPVDNIRRTEPGSGPTQYDVTSAELGHDHAANAAPEHTTSHD